MNKEFQRIATKFMEENKELLENLRDM